MGLVGTNCQERFEDALSSSFIYSSAAAHWWCFQSLPLPQTIKKSSSSATPAPLSPPLNPRSQYNLNLFIAHSDAFPLANLCSGPVHSSTCIVCPCMPIETTCIHLLHLSSCLLTRWSGTLIELAGQGVLVLRDRCGVPFDPECNQTLFEGSMINAFFCVLFPNSFSYGVFANIGSRAVPGRLPNHGFREGSGEGSEPRVPGRFRDRFRGCWG